MPPPDPNLASILYSAIASPHGLALSVSDFGGAQQKLYAVRRALADPDLASLQFRRSPYSDTELWLTKTTGRKTPTHVPTGPNSPS